jgi:hypothetical protein
MAGTSTGTPITPAGISALLRIDFRRVYYENGDERPREYPLWCNVDDMEWTPQTDKQMAGLTSMGEKPVGERFRVDNPLLGGTKDWTPRPYGKAVELTFEGWRDENYGTMETLVAEMAKAGREREEIDAHSALNNAFDTTYAGFTSGEALIGDHVGQDGVTRRNAPTVAVGFSVTGIQQMILHFHTLTNERGRRMRMAPSMLIIHPNNLFTAREILGSGSKPFTTDNEMNSLIAEDLTYLAGHYLTSLTAWFGLASKGIHDIQFLWRDMPSFDMFDDPWTRNAIATCYQRHTRGEYAAWRGVYGSNP